MINIASAEDLPQTKAHQQLSVTRGFAQSDLAVLHRNNTDQQQVSAAIIEKLRPEGPYQRANRGKTLRLTGKQWSLEVAEDGSAAEYRDLAVAARAHSLARPLSEEMSPAELEAKGRAFIASKLASQIVLGEGEELPALRADYRTEGTQNLATGVITNAVSGNRIVFGRTIHGIPVVGNGSKVILTFTNDGALESFRYDWPEYHGIKSQSLIDAAQILSRVQKVIAARNGVDTPQTRVSVPSGQGEPFPLALTPNTQLQSLDCGYYDAGSFVRQHSQSVQPGCTYLTVSQDEHGFRQGFAGAVPAGDRFDLDRAWLETQLLTRQ